MHRRKTQFLKANTEHSIKRMKSEHDLLTSLTFQITTLSLQAVFHSRLQTECHLSGVSDETRMKRRQMRSHVFAPLFRSFVHPFVGGNIQRHRVIERRRRRFVAPQATGHPPIPPTGITLSLSHFQVCNMNLHKKSVVSDEIWKRDENHQFIMKIWQWNYKKENQCHCGVEILPLLPRLLWGVQVQRAALPRVRIVYVVHGVYKWNKQFLTRCASRLNL